MNETCWVSCCLVITRSWLRPVPTTSQLAVLCFRLREHGEAITYQTIQEHVDIPQLMFRLFRLRRRVPSRLDSVQDLSLSAHVPYSGKECTIAYCIPERGDQVGLFLFWRIDGHSRCQTPDLRFSPFHLVVDFSWIVREQVGSWTESGSLGHGRWEELG